MMKKILITAVTLFAFSATAFALPSYNSVEDCDSECEFQLDMENLNVELSSEFNKDLKADIEKQVTRQKVSISKIERSEG